MIDWCKSCKYYGESSLSYPCAICERAYDNAPPKWESNDHVRVVRCKDCKYYTVHCNSQYNGTRGKCKLIDDNDTWFGDDFCSYGVREE